MIKKILATLALLLILILASLIMLKYNVKDILLASTIRSFEVKMENAIEDIAESSISNEVSEDKAEDKKKETTVNIISSAKNTKKDKYNNTGTTSKNNTATNNKVPGHKSTTTNNVIINKNNNQITETTDKEDKIVESYRINNNVINTMKNTIERNPSSFMKEYGFNVVVDSNIVNEVNQFTYTESRVKNYIQNRFGTIKIYARDYYCNNVYTWTEAFIL